MGKGIIYQDFVVAGICLLWSGGAGCGQTAGEGNCQAPRHADWGTGTDKSMGTVLRRKADYYVSLSVIICKS